MTYPAEFESVPAVNAKRTPYRLLFVLTALPLRLLDRSLHRAAWLKQDLACALMPARRRAIRNWVATARPQVRYPLSPIWLVAVGGVAPMYVGIRFLEAIQRRFPSAPCVFIISHSNMPHFPDNLLRDSDVLLPLPELCCAAVRRRMADLRPACVLKIGYGINQSLLSLPNDWRVPTAWLAAEMLDDDTSSLRRQPLKRWYLKRTFEMIFADTENSRRNLLALGVAPELVHVAGAAKYDAAAPLQRQIEAAETLLRRLRWPDDKLVLLAASLADGEVTILLELYGELKSRFPKLVLILAPISPRRSRLLITEAMRVKRLRLVFRSDLDVICRDPVQPPDVFVLDSFGELKGFYPFADIVFSGRTLMDFGGSNVIEPMGAGRPVMIGPHHSCTEVIQELKAAGAIVQVESAYALREGIAELLNDNPRREEYGRRARAIVQQRQGVVERTLDVLEAETSCFSTFVRRLEHCKVEL